MAILTAISGSGLVGWNAAETVSQGKQIEKNSADISALRDSLIDLKATSDATLTTAQGAQKDSAVVKEIVKLMSPRFQINADAVETRVIREVASSTQNVLP